MKIFLIFLIAVVIIYIFFYEVTKFLMKTTGCTKVEAERKIQAFVTGKPEYHLANDEFFKQEVCNALRNILGETKYNELNMLSTTCNVWGFFYDNDRYMFRICVPYEDENEKLRIENVLKNIMVKYLEIHDYCKFVMADWSDNSFLKLPELRLSYAETEKQAKILRKIWLIQNQDIINKNNPVVDDEIE